MDLAFTPLRVILGSAVLSLGSLFFGPKLSGGIASKENCAPSAMYDPELRTCGLGAVVSVLLGAGIGFGWH